MVTTTLIPLNFKIKDVSLFLLYGSQTSCKNFKKTNEMPLGYIVLKERWTGERTKNGY